jgi:RNA polymerase sigma factor (sigma-70 family)
MATRRTREPLTPDQQRLAARYRPMARKMAKPLKRIAPAHWEEYESAANMALVEAAEAWRPQVGTSFSFFAKKRIWGALKDVSRQRWARKRLARDGAEPAHLGDLRHDDELDGRVLGIEPEPEPGWGLEEEDAVEGWLRKLPPGHAAALRRIYIWGETHAQAAKSVGLSPSRVTYIHQEAIAMLQGTWAGQRPGSPALSN